MSLSRAQKNLIRALYSRHGRKKYGLALCEGERACRELFAAAPELVELVALTPALARRFPDGVPGSAMEVKAEELDGIAATVNSPGILAVLRIPEAPAPAAGMVADPFILALDRIGDPGNFGTMVRTARAAGLREIWYTAGSVEPFSDKVIRSSLGALFSMRLREFPTLAELTRTAAEAGFGPVWLTVPAGGESCFAAEGLFTRSVVVIGNEAHGIPPETPGRRVTIPMPGGFESLNAAQAATIVIFEYVRRLETA